MSEIAELAGHPLVLLVAGAVLSGWLVPRVTRRWQDRRAALDVKVQLVERVSAAVTDLFTATQFAQVGAASQTQADLDAAYRTWQRERAMVTSLLTAYFRDDDVHHAWVRCRTLVTAYYVQTGISERIRRSAYLAAVERGLAMTPPVDRSEDPVADGDDAAASQEALTDVNVLRARTLAALSATVIVDRRALV